MDILPLLDLGRSMRSRKICSSNVPHTTPFILLLFLWHLHTHYQNLKAFLGFCSQLWLIYHEVLVSCFPQTSVHPSTIQLPKFCCSLLTSILIISLFALLRGYPICTALCHVSTEGVELHVCVSSLEALLVLGNISGGRSWEHGEMHCYSGSAGMVGMGWGERPALSGWRHIHSDGEGETRATRFSCANESVKIIFAWWSNESLASLVWMNTKPHKHKSEIWQLRPLGNTEMFLL